MRSATMARSVHVIAAGENRPHAAVFLRHHRAVHSVRRSPGRRVRDGWRGAAHAGRSSLQHRSHFSCTIRTSCPGHSGVRVLLVQEPRSLYGAERTVALSKLDRHIDDDAIQLALRDEEAK